MERLGYWKTMISSSLLKHWQMPIVGINILIFLYNFRFVKAVNLTLLKKVAIKNQDLKNVFLNN